MNIFISYLATLVPLVALDAIWILLVAKKFYAQEMGFLFQQSTNLTPVAFFYPLYALAVLALAILPALASGNWVDALWRGALLGLVAYGAYDLTNQATIAGWPTLMTFVDMGWGTVVTGLTAVLGYAIIVALR